MATWIIPLTPEPQAFGITLAGRELRLTVRWFSSTCGVISGSEQIAQGVSESGSAREHGITTESGEEGGWLLDVAEPDSAASIISCIPLVAGCDLLAPYSYLELGGELWLDGEMPPALEDLGETVQLCFVTEEE